MMATFDELAFHAEHHQAELRREAELRRLVRRRTLASGRTLRIVPPARLWPSQPDDEPTAA